MSTAEYGYANLAPENVVIAVNDRSWCSWVIADYYAQLRSIPESNVIAVDWPGPLTATDLSTFRKFILNPIQREIRKRGLDDKIHCIAYSSDFPYAIEFGTPSSGRFPVGSITGITFLTDERTLDVDYGRSKNPYFSLTGETQSFADYRTTEDGSTHRLAVLLGYTSGRGNSLVEVLRCLTLSRFADGVFPGGTVYLAQTDDIRSRTRSRRFPWVQSKLERAGRACEVISTPLPRRKKDVFGAVLGSSYFRWVRSGCRIVPGAICENLTSFGGVLEDHSPQVSLAEMTRHGAAGTTGTVVEPFAIAAKFPDPSVHYNYHRGLCMAEAIYRSVELPYQLLIVGDPLCRPMGRARANLPNRTTTLQRVVRRPKVRVPHRLDNPQVVLATDQQQRGITLRKSGAPPIVVESTTEPGWLRTTGVRVGESFQIDAQVQAKQGGIHRVQLLMAGRANVSLNGQSLLMIRSTDYQRYDIPVHLVRGAYTLNVSGQLASNDHFEIRFGRKGARRLGDNSFAVNLDR